MKHTLFFFLFAAFTFVGCKSKEKVSEPEDIGRQALGVLEQMNDLSPAEFNEYFISHKELTRIVEKRKVRSDEEAGLAATLPAKKQLKIHHSMMRRRLKFAGRRYGINWSKIKYVGFSYEREGPGEVKFYTGTLRFNYRGHGFTAYTSSIYDGSHYYLTNISGVHKDQETDAI